MGDRPRTVIVVSTIYVATGPISYSSTRSVFTAEQRARQTRYSILSVRKRLPGAKVILLEHGTRPEVPANLADLADEYVYSGGNFWVRKATDGPFKGLGEAVALLSLIPRLNGKWDYFKLSGRYILSRSFRESQWTGNNAIFAFRHRNSISTVLYRIPGRLLRRWRIALLFCVPFLLLNRSLENWLHVLFPDKCIDRIPQMGVCGYVGVNRKIFHG